MENKPVQNTQTKKGLPKQTIAFIALLVIVTLILLGLAVYTQKIVPPSPTTSNQVKFPVYAHTTLKLTPPQNTTPYLPNTYSTDVVISTGANKITGAQLELSYDPKILTNVEVKTGSFISNPVVVLKKIDQQNGRISLAIAIPLGVKGVSGDGTIATITFDEAPQATGSTLMEFLPKTSVWAQGVAPSVLKESFGALFLLNQPQAPVPTSATGTTSAQ